MTTEKSLGIWMDHSHAHLMEFTMHGMEDRLVTIPFDHEDQEFGFTKNEKTAHHKEQKLQTVFYKQLGDVIAQYEDVLLFGPTEARVELLNALRSDHHFDKIKIETLPADKLTEGQQHAFVRTYFKKRGN